MGIKKQRPLLATLKEKKRYVVFKVIAEKQLNFDEVKNEILKESSLFLGRLGIARAGLMFMNDWEDNCGVLRVNNKFVDYVKASFCLIDKVGVHDAIVRSIGVSGILKKARNNFMEVE